MLNSKKDDFQTIILFNEDLREEFKYWKIKDIEFSHFLTESREILMKASLVLYIDRNTLQTKILKNRWGNENGVAR